ncbi:MAG: TSUP family transporter [Deltaproteobacteria bacterium]|nr:TSUP family transporter [Deltaproteobacteria bacterium]
MAGGLVLMGVAATILPVASAMVFHGATQLASNGSRAFVLRAHIRWRTVGWQAAGAVAALALHLAMSFTPDRPTLLLVLGAIPFVARALPKSSWLDASRPLSAAACGFVTTGLQLIAGVAGPLLDVWFLNVAFDRKEIVATKAATQALSHSFKILRFAPLIGSTDGVSVEILAASAIAALAGTAVGTRILERVSERDFRKWTGWTVLAIGTVYIAQAIAGC